MVEEKNKLTAGADERTPSHPQYFSWVNSTNEGSTEAQTLINLDYFRYLYDTYGMRLEIYAWDAGNLDGSAGTYQLLGKSEKLKKQYPNGYGPIAEAAAKIGTRLGVWCGPDGFGDTEESAKARTEQMVSLCRDFHFAQFKIDGVCGQLAEEHQPLFVEMMKECRKYSPDLVLLNHRLWLGIGMPYATTFLWQGAETYVDVHMGNLITAPHHRAFFASRGNVPQLLRLTEDHGVCISSCIDYFEDDLIFQAFGRCLILAPEIYANPWLMRDDEEPILARIYNLHYRFRDILVNGMLLPGGTYPPNSVSRGTPSRRFLVVGNDEWETWHMYLRLDAEIGLQPCEKVTVCSHHPYEKYIGEFNYGEVIEVEIEPFRAALFEVCDSREADVMLTNCEYEVLHEDKAGKIDRIKVVSSEGNIKYTDGRDFSGVDGEFDNTLRAPEKLASIGDGEFDEKVSDSAAKMLEVAMFVQDHDSLEARSLKRSGETAIPEVKTARDAFFGQKTYMLRGPESRFAFDGNDDTFFDGISKTFFGGLRRDGGCLRVDFGEVFDADFIELEYFDIDESMAYEVKKQVLPGKCDFSVDLENWHESTVEDVTTLRHETTDVLIHNVHNIVQRDGRRRVVRYALGGDVRYFRMPQPIDRIYRISLTKDGKRLELTAPRANNLMPVGREVKYSKTLSVSVAPESWRHGCYLSIGLEGTHGAEGAYAVIESADGEFLGCPDRAAGYNSNIWECRADFSYFTDHHYTYYFPVPREMCGKEFKIHILGLDEENKKYGVNVYLCDDKTEVTGIEADVEF